MYLFPHSENYIDVNDEARMLMFQPSCLRFNCKNEFNFNKLFKSGVNYRQLLTEATIIKQLVTEKVMEAEANGGVYAPLT